jgi:hypothetical protein
VSAEFDRSAESSLREFSMDELGAAFLGRALGRAPERGLVEAFVATYIAEWNGGVHYLDGLGELLERLSRRFTLSIVTNTHPPDLVPDHLQRRGVAKHFHSVVTSVELGLRKPHPGIFEIVGPPASRRLARTTASLGSARSAPPTSAGSLALAASLRAFGACRLPREVLGQL